MITLDKAIGIIERKFPNAEIKRAAYYKDNYLFVAPDKTLGANDMNDPYYLVSKSDGTVKKMIPSSDILGFTDAFRNHEIKDL